MKDPRVIWRSASKDLVISIELRQWLPVAACFFLLGWYIAAPTGVAILALITLSGVMIADFLWARTMARSVRCRRQLRFVAMQVGDELEEEIHLINKQPLLPVLWAEIFDHSNIPGYTISSVRAADADSQIAWRVHTTCTRRGVFNLGPWELRIGQPFGFFLVHQHYLHHQEVLVYPPIATLPDRILSHRGSLGDNRPLNQPLRAETISTTSVRSYEPGDPFRRIHWRTTARHVSPFVKVFEPEAASRIWLIPDFHSQSHLVSEDNSSIETMVTVTASLSASFLQQNFSVGMVACAQIEAVVLPRQGQIHLWSILQSLAPLQPSNFSLATLLSRAGSLFSANDLLVVITPDIQIEWVGELKRLARIRGGMSRAEIILLDPVSFSGQDQVKPVLSIVQTQGIPVSILRTEDVRIIQDFYGAVSRWEFKILGTGRVVARSTPRGISKAEIMAGGLNTRWEDPV